MSGAEASAATGATPSKTRDPKYLRMMLALILTASLFEGYDNGILDVATPAIQDTFGLSEGGIGVMRTVIRLGAVAAFFVALSADRVGRRPILLWSIVGYTVATALTTASPNVYIFVSIQFVAQVFLASEYAVAVTMISEEYPPDKRGKALGWFSLVAAAGVILVPLLGLAGLAQIPGLEWRAYYLVGILPLLLTSFLRRRIQETVLFEERRDRGETVGKGIVGVFGLEPWDRRFRRPMVVMAFITFFRSFAVYSATSWWVWYAEREIGLPTSIVLGILIGAYGLGIGGYYVCGRLIDSWGRKPVAISFPLLAFVFGIGVFNTRSLTAQIVFVIVTVFFGLGMAPALNAYYTELFPTRVRASAAAWQRNVFEIPGLLIGPLLVGIVGDHAIGALGAVGGTVTVLFGTLPVVAWLVWRYLPETRGLELESLETGLQSDEIRVSGGKVLAGVIGIGLIVVAAGVALSLVARTDEVRPEGVAERWLRAVSRGVDQQIVERDGTLEAASIVIGRPWVPAKESRDWLLEFEVAPQVDAPGSSTRVPVRLERRTDGDAEPEETELTLVGEQRDGSWFFTSALAGTPDVRYPSDGGPSFSAPLSWVLVLTLLTGIGSFVLSTVVINAVKPPEDDHVDADDDSPDDPGAAPDGDPERDASDDVTSPA